MWNRSEISGGFVGDERVSNIILLSSPVSAPWMVHSLSVLSGLSLQFLQFVTVPVQSQPDVL